MMIVTMMMTMTMTMKDPAENLILIIRIEMMMSIILDDHNDHNVGLEVSFMNGAYGGAITLIMLLRMFITARVLKCSKGKA